ncbi:DUF2975 domain-containing protein [Neobacillus vireti]|uniref:DUF2975 domain-containing protein n=1 Tax=Neobacillus vireti TaxID=220686 RepID=UPI002FFDB3D8
MNRGAIFFLKGVILLIGISVLAMCLFLFPEIASRDTAKYPETAYLQYPFLLSVYLLSIPFFIGLYKGFNLLIYIEKNKTFSALSVRALKAIKRCAIIISASIATGLIFLVVMSAGKGEDITGLISLGFMLTFASSVIATFAGVLQRLVKEVIDIKLENDLIV